MLGSWWAYSELGWGGWWFWDPVENASFMPWLVATALIHSLAVTEQRGAFRAWTLLLAIFGFSLSLLGTFLVRSGVLVSVHAFATDPARGVFILAFLGLVIGSALGLYAWRAARLAGGGGSFEPCSRETFLLANNVLLVATSGTVLLGTLYPLLIDALGQGKISVGPPYFNAVFVPLMLPLAALLGFAPLARWKATSGGACCSSSGCRWPSWCSRPWGWRSGPRPRGPWPRVPGSRCGSPRGSSWGLRGPPPAPARRWIRPPGARPRLHRHDPRPPRGCGVHRRGHLDHRRGVERDVRLAPGESATLAGHSFRFEGMSGHLGPNYRAVRGTLHVSRDGEQVAVLHPEKRTYISQAQPMTEAAVHAGFTRDLYVALGEPVGGTDGAWTMRLQYKPLVRWIWLGPLMMAIGGLLSASDRRYRRSLRPERARTAAVPTEGARAYG